MLGFFLKAFILVSLEEEQHRVEGFRQAMCFNPTP